MCIFVGGIKNWLASVVLFELAMSFCFLGIFGGVLLLLKKSQVYLRRNSEGRIDPDGKIWAAPYRWGCMVIAYKKTKFKKHNLAPIKVSCIFSHFMIG